MRVANLSNKMSDKWDVCILFVQAILDVGHHWDDKPAAEQMDHSIQDCLFKLQLQ